MSKLNIIYIKTKRQTIVHKECLGQAQTDVAGLNRLVRCQSDLLIIGSLTAI